MATFVPIPGSVASVAFNDPDFPGLEWSFGQRNVSEAFGEDWVGYQMRYDAQVLNFNFIRDQDVSELTDSALDPTGTRLKATLRAELRRWIIRLQKCEEIIAECENIPSDDSRDAVDSVLQIPQRDRSPASTSGSTQPGSPEAPSSSMRQKIRSFFRRARPSDNRTVWPAGEVQNSSGITMAPSNQVQIGSTPQTRWRARKAEFLSALDNLSKTFTLLSANVQPWQPTSSLAMILDDQKLREVLPKYQHAADRLKQLITSIKNQLRTDEIAFQLRLYSDPFELRDALRTRSATCNEHIEDSGAVFFMRLSPETDSQSASVSQPDSPRHMVFNVGPRDSSLNNDDAIETVHNLMLSVPASPRDDWAVFLGHINQEIRVLCDTTNRIAEQDLVNCFSDSHEKAAMTKANQAGTRARLAFIVTCALYHKIHAEGAHGFQAADMKYYTTVDERGNDPGYSQSRVTPFIPLSTAGSTRVQQSSLNTLPGVDTSEVTMVKNLGILLYEIGTWTSVTGSTLLDRISVANRGKYFTEEIHPKYPDIIDACLRYKDRKDVGRWLLKYAILPLKETYESITAYGVCPP